MHSIHVTVLSVRLDEEIEKQLQFVMRKLNLQNKSAIVRQLLTKSLQDRILDITCNEVKLGNISAWKAAQTANVSLYKILEELYDRNIEIYDEKAFLEDFEFMRKINSIDH